MSESLGWSPRLGEHLKASRTRAGMRRVDLAGQLGVSEETIRLWERGAVRPAPERLARLIALLALEVAEWPSRSETSTELPPLARRLRTEREARGITQAEAVRMLGLSQGTYAGWETGRSIPGEQFFAALAMFLGISERDVATLCSSPFVVDTSGWPPFGQFVGARRQELGLTRPDLAAALGVTVGTIATWELGYRAPGSTQLPRLALALGVETSSLVAALPRRPPGSTLGDLIRQRLLELGLRAADVAERTGTTEGTVSRWVHGRNLPAPENLRRLAVVLEVPLEQVTEAAGRAA